MKWSCSSIYHCNIISNMWMTLLFNTAFLCVVLLVCVNSECVSSQTAGAQPQTMLTAEAPVWQANTAKPRVYTTAIYLLVFLGWATSHLLSNFNAAQTLKSGGWQKVEAIVLVFHHWGINTNAHFAYKTLKFITFIEFLLLFLLVEFTSNKEWINGSFIDFSVGFFLI